MGESNRKRHDNDAEHEHDQGPKKKRPSSALMGITRSIAACKRCRIKKIKCDQHFPTCAKCAASNSPCVSVDPATGRDVPRSYVVYLEDRVEAMMQKLRDCGVDPSQVQGNIPATDQDQPCDLGVYEERLRTEHKIRHDNVMAGYIINNGTSMKKGVLKSTKPEIGSSRDSVSSSEHKDNDLISELSESAKSLQSLGSMKHSHSKSTESAMGAASNSYLGDSSGIPFAKLIFTAINFLPDAVEEASKEAEDVPVKKNDNSVFKLSYLPTKKDAQGLISQYFNCCNAQLPILHREYFLKRFFEPIYGPWDSKVSLGSDTTTINEHFKLPPEKEHSDLMGEEWYEPSLSEVEGHDKEIPIKFHVPLFFLNIVMAVGDSAKILTTDESKSAAYKDRASALVDALFRSDDQMEALAGTLLVAQYSTMRPNVPGVWYTMGSALRLAVDLGLHAEKLNQNYDPFTRDMRRRLFWCTYCLDRQICAFFGRPFGIPDENVTSVFPSSLDDALITTAVDDIEDYSEAKSAMASYKCVAIAFFKVRKLQADIVQGLYTQRKLPSGFRGLPEWREHMNSRLDDWFQKQVPKTARKMNCDFRIELFQLELFHSKVLLYGLCPKCMSLDDHGYKMVYHSTKGIIDVYYKLCNEDSIMYTWVAVHTLFMSGVTFLYVLHNAGVDLGDTIADAEKTCVQLVHVLERLVGKCEAAKKGSIIFKVLSAAILKLKAENTDNPGSASQPVFQSGSQPGSRSTPRSNSLHASDQTGSEGSLVALGEEPRLSSVNNNTRKDAAASGVAYGALDQFFAELDKLSPFSDPNTDLTGLAGSYDTPELVSLPATSADAAAYDKVEQELEKGPISETMQLANSTSKDGQRVYDMMSQFSAETIWDQVFNTGGMYGVSYGNQEQ
ncbi:LAME_0D07162g1_1 [Lachancea meyersii CBS 8951]|uniref:LAME_0D07162g1_1 n=1 Tax=Lachancea meyersii CBS 8951 TaxID=1266667 RepID=A0A1G4J9U5_9SACH|nr:LAME_0D07162g1_1 [Lachancea meyersii CBS 8951]